MLASSPDYGTETISNFEESQDRKIAMKIAEEIVKTSGMSAEKRKVNWSRETKIADQLSNKLDFAYSAEQRALNKR